MPWSRDPISLWPRYILHNSRRPDPVKVGLFRSIPQRGLCRALRAGGNLEILETIGMPWVISLEVIHNVVGQWKLEILDALDHALGDFVAAVIAVMRVLIGAGEGLRRGVGAYRFVKGGGHV